MRLRAALLLATLLAAAAGAQPPTTAAPDSEPAPRRPLPKLPPRRVPVTPELERSAFADPGARALLARARAARVAQDSALRAYDAKSYLRYSMGVGVRRLGAERLLMRAEQAARVRWARGSGVWVEPTAQRAAFSLGGAHVDLTDATPIPYFPGRESLWLPGNDKQGMRLEVNENDFLHPLATGAEAYYRYDSGDSVTIRLPDGRAIALRELRVTARRPDYRSFVGSFWFDVERGDLVRAAYRLATEVSLWQMGREEMRKELAQWEERARTDTGAALAEARRELKRLRSELNGVGMKIAEGIFSPARAKLSAITVEYGLYEGRFWLPKLNVAEGEIQGGPVRVPLKWEESFRYDAVNGSAPVPPVPAAGEGGLVAADTVWRGSGFLTVGGTPGTGDTLSMATRRARADSLVRAYTRNADSLRTLAAEVRAKGDTARARRLREQARWWEGSVRGVTRWRDGCAGGDSSYLAGATTRSEGQVRIGIRRPCDPWKLARAEELPGSIYEPGEALFGTAERDALLGALGFALQPGWGPQRPRLHSGLDLLRYNRVEGLSVGATATSELGLGYTAQALARFGVGDRVPNGELSLARSNGRAEVRLAAFHRLGVANDDWGSPLSFGASVSNLLYARDEGFYYRTWGAELAGSRDAPGPLGGARLTWRAFAERQRSAGVEPNTQASLGNLFANPRFGANIDAAGLTAVGAGAALARSFGADARRTRLDARLRTEGALTRRADSLGTTGYGRLLVDATVSRPVLGLLAASLTGAAGAAAGDLPAQRAFYLGGLQTVRGQFARPAGAGRVGDAFWLGRAELGIGWTALRPTAFYDVGWAGPRGELAHPGRPLSGVGGGVSFLDGLFRVDVSRGISPEKRWRADVYLGARF